MSCLLILTVFNTINVGIIVEAGPPTPFWIVLIVNSVFRSYGLLKGTKSWLNQVRTDVRIQIHHGKCQKKLIIFTKQTIIDHNVLISSALIEEDLCLLLYVLLHSLGYGLLELILELIISLLIWYLLFHLQFWQRSPCHSLDQQLKSGNRLE